MIRHLALALASVAVALPAAHAAPLSRAETGHATVPVVLDGEEYDFVLDTGAQGTAVYSDFVESEGIALSDEVMTLIGQTGEIEVPLAQLDHLSVDGIEAGRLNAVVLPQRKDGSRLNGILGLDFFGDKVLDLDVSAKVADFHGDLSGVEVEGWVPIKAERIAGGLLAIPVQVGGIEVTAVLDSGARTTKINQDLADQLGLSPQSPGVRPGPVTLGATNHEKKTWLAPVADIVVGGVTIEESEVLLSETSVFEVFGLADSPSLLLGLNWMAEGRLVIDFENETVWFGPSATAGSDDA